MNTHVYNGLLQNLQWIQTDNQHCFSFAGKQRGLCYNFKDKMWNLPTTDESLCLQLHITGQCLFIITQCWKEFRWHARAIYKDKAEQDKENTNGPCGVWGDNVCFPPNPGLMSPPLWMSGPWFTILPCSSTLIFCFYLPPPLCIYFTLSFVIQFELVPSLQSVTEGVWFWCYHVHQQ